MSHLEKFQVGSKKYEKKYQIQNVKLLFSMA